MIYRNWSLLSSTVIIWGSVATVGLTGIFVTGTKDKFMDYLKHEGARLRQEDRAIMAQAKKCDNEPTADAIVSMYVMPMTSFCDVVKNMISSG
ncbi:Succinate dehydrogenase subunit 8A [Carex littledalei]|uniref:Succinate dehydrogenase subunit 8A n=1 Tax=Carex littledalei TaxID=544730 RepID=A0A833QTC1_9POAL|nr:Succinate dehydrogenase subunit 8A [Carex littledalei]